MLIDELQEKLKMLEPDIHIFKTYWQAGNLEEEYNNLLHTTQQENFWQHPERDALLKKLQQLKTRREQYLYIIRSFEEMPALLTLFNNDEQELVAVAAELYALIKEARSFKINILLNKPEDSSNCFLNINSGAGGTESQDWADMLLRMYTRFCEREKFKAQLVDYQTGEGAGIKSATLFITGTNVYGLLKAEEGIHRLVRISPFDAAKRRHTSFAAVSAIPELQEVKIAIDQKDLRIDTYRAGGAGGQHVNKTESAVRITHLPTGTVVQCQNERSQIQNRETAMKMLYAKLAQKEKEEQEALLAKTDKKKIEWGSQIRSYVLHPYKMVKDHRTDQESPQPELVLDGDIMPFIEKYLVQQAT